MKKGKKEKKLLDWLKNECKDWRTLVAFILVTIILYSPAWGGYLIYFLFKWKWAFSIASFWVALWLGPFTPFFPLCIAITLVIKRIIEKIGEIGKNKRN